MNVETRSIAPDEVKRGGKFIEVRFSKESKKDFRRPIYASCVVHDDQHVAIGFGELAAVD